MPLHIAYSQNGNGRSGHRLKDLFSSITISEAVGAVPAFDSTWENQQLLPLSNVERALSPRNPPYERVLRINPKKRYFQGIPVSEFKEIRDAFTPLVRSSKQSLAVISGVFRLHPFQLSNWEAAGIVERGAFDRSIQKLREIYWWNDAPAPKQQRTVEEIAIHARRGDVANSTSKFFDKMGPGSYWSAEFYSNLIARFKEAHPKARITIYSERKNSKDLHPLRKHAELALGGGLDLCDHFQKMISADIFVPANSSLSTWAAHLSIGDVHLHNKDIFKDFRFKEFPSNFKIFPPQSRLERASS